MRPGYIHTYTGKLFYPLEPDPELICIEDIAHGLANQCRFAGQAVCRYYSVAEHCIHVSRICDPSVALWGLLHDAAEAYLGDMPRPLKHATAFGAVYREAEDALMAAICDRFGLRRREPESVDIADGAVLLAERRDLIAPLEADMTSWLHGKKVSEPADVSVRYPLSPHIAEGAYLHRFWEVT